jgi:hypothetical protein
MMYLSNLEEEQGVLNQFQDSYSRIHHKPCINGEPSSNNGWIYSAYSHKLGFKLDFPALYQCYRQCLKKNPDTGKMFLIRSPNKELPPNSRDEILGVAYLGLLKPSHLDGWNFSPRTVPAFNPIKLAKQLWDLRPSLKRHRNYFWENNLDQLYRFAFSVPLQDRHFVAKHSHFKINPVAKLFYWTIAKIDSIVGSDSGIRWLKYDKSLQAMLEEFPAEHPFQHWSKK